MKILYLSNIPSPYRVEYFNKLGEKCELTVLFEKEVSDERDSSWSKYQFSNFNGIILNGIKVKTDMAFCPSVIRYLKKTEYDVIICCNFLSPTGSMAVNYMKIKKIPYWLESDGGFAKNVKGIKEKIKKLIVSGAYGYFSTSDEHDNYYLAYGARKERIYRYPFTSLSQEDILKQIISNKEKQNIRNNIGINEEKVLLSVGQFIYRKGFDILLKACKELKQKNVGVYIIGGDETEEYKQICRENNLRNVHFLPFLEPVKLADYYKAADIFIMPTREDIWGLVINEAMSYGLPVISSNRCIAAQELVHEAKNGFLFESEDSKDLYKKIQYLLEHPEKCEEYAKNSLSYIRNYSYTDMVDSHIKCLQEKR